MFTYKFINMSVYLLGYYKLSLKRKYGNKIPQKYLDKIKEYENTIAKF